VQALRRRQGRNLMATLLLSSGVPMLSMGDEVRRTQAGNNNAYCQDSALSWMPWDVPQDGAAMAAFTARLVALRRAHPVFRQQLFFLGRPVADDGVVKDLAWFGASGQELSAAQWWDPHVTTLAMYVDGRGIRTRGPRGEALVDDSFLLVLHTSFDPGQVVLPGRPWARTWSLLVDTRAEDGDGDDRVLAGGATVPLEALSLLLLRAQR
jgi:glycogen operon protein